MTLEERIDLNVTKALNVCRSDNGYQASLEVATGTFRVCWAKTASAAIADVLGREQAGPPVGDFTSSVFD